MKDKEALIKSAEVFATDIAENMLGLPRVATATIIKSLVKNNIEKYEQIIDLFINKDGKIIDVDDLFASFKEILDEKPITIWKLKFTGKDIDELRKIFEEKRK